MPVLHRNLYTGQGRSRPVPTLSPGHSLRRGTWVGRPPQGDRRSFGVALISPITTPRRKLEFIRKDRNHTEAQSLKTQLLYGLFHTERANDRINHLCSSFPVVFSKALMTMDSKRNETSAGPQPAQ